MHRSFLKEIRIGHLPDRQIFWAPFTSKILVYNLTSTSPKLQPFTVGVVCVIAFPFHTNKLFVFAQLYYYLGKPLLGMVLMYPICKFFFIHTILFSLIHFHFNVFGTLIFHLFVGNRYACHVQCLCSVSSRALQNRTEHNRSAG